MTPHRISYAQLRLTSLLGIVALVGGAIAVAPASASQRPGAAGSPSESPDPIGIAAESVTWDEDGGSSSDDDQLGPGGEGTAGTEYTTSGYIWDRTDLTYGFDSWTADLSVAQQKAAAANALDQWAQVSPLTFTEVADCGLSFNHPSCTTPDIRIVFGSGDHGAGSSDPNFDGPGGVVGHAYGPVPDAWNYTAGGDIHLDDAETWKANGSAIDLETVILHESGHSLGLAHTNKSCSAPPGPSRPIMCSVLTGTQRVLGTDDVNGIQALYGTPPPDIPDGVDVEIIESGSAGGSSVANEHLVKIVNGYDNDLTGASLDVTGVSGCDQIPLSAPANSVTYSTCGIDPDPYLDALDTSETETLTATLSADGIADTSDGPKTVAVMAADHDLVDVPNWVDPAVDWITYWDLADGYPNGYFRPDNPITRAQVTRMIWRHAGEPAAGAPLSFWDVPPWVEDAVSWASFDPVGPTEPLMTGLPNGTFRPGDPISRAEVVRLLYRYVGSPDVSTLPDHGFSDVPSWVEDAVKWAAYDPDGAGPLESVIGGYPDGTFRPDDDITRAQHTRSLFRLTAQLVP